MDWIRRVWLDESDPGAPPPEASNPDFMAPAEEAILSKLDTDGAPIQPDGTKGAPAQSEFDWEAHMKGTPSEEPTGSEGELETETFDEVEHLKNLGVNYESVDDLAAAFKDQQERINTLSENLTQAGFQVTDDVIQDLNDLAEKQVVSQQPSFLTGVEHTQPAVPPQPVQPTAPTAPQAAPPGQVSYQATANFLGKYGQLKWTPDFIRDLSTAMAEFHQPAQKQDTTSFVSREDLNGVANMFKRTFRDSMIADHMVSRLARGDKLPTNYRDQLVSAVDKNPALLERAWQGYVARGRSNGFVDDYAKGILADRDPKTGLSGAETQAMARETEAAVAAKRTITGGEAPKAGGKPKQPTTRDMEMSIERMGKLL